MTCTIAIIAVPARVSTLPREHLASATRAGARFVRNAPALKAIMIRAAAFGFFAAGVWALLPLVARHTLGLGSGGYGVLLGCVGIGALAGATFSPALRRMLSPQALIAICSGVVALPALVLAVSHTAVLDGAALAVSGTGWIVACPGRYVETFLVGSWEEHQRQHARATAHDEATCAAHTSLPSASSRTPSSSRTRSCVRTPTRSPSTSPRSPIASISSLSDARR